MSETQTEGVTCRGAVRRGRLLRSGERGCGCAVCKRGKRVARRTQQQVVGCERRGVGAPAVAHDLVSQVCGADGQLHACDQPPRRRCHPPQRSLRIPKQTVGQACSLHSLHKSVVLAKCGHEHYACKARVASCSQLTSIQVQRHLRSRQSTCDAHKGLDGQLRAADTQRHVASIDVFTLTRVISQLSGRRKVRECLSKARPQLLACETLLLRLRA